MSQSNKELSLSLSRIRSEVSQMTAGDQDRLVKIGIALEATLMQIPEEMPAVIEALTLCLQALQAIYQEQVEDFSAIIKSMNAVLIGAEQAVAAYNNPICLHMLNQAREILQQSLGAVAIETEESSPASDPTESAATEPEPVEEAVEVAVAMSLDDVSALYMQIEPTDREELARLCDALKEISSEDSTPTAARKILVKAARELNKLAQGKAKNAETVFASVGELLEQAANAMQGGEIAKIEEPVKIEKVSAAVVAPSPKAASSKTEKSETVTINFEPDALPPDTDHGLVMEFITESSEYIEASEAALLSLETDPDNLEDVNTVFRAFHTVKGTSAFLGLKRLSGLAHHAESLLSRVRDREIRFTGGYADLALRSVDTLKEMLETIRGALNGRAMTLPETYGELIGILANPEAAGISSETTTKFSETTSASGKTDLESDKSAAESSEAAPQAAPKSGNKLRLGDVLVAHKKVTREQVELAARKQGKLLLGEMLVSLGFATAEDIEQAVRILEQQNKAIPQSAPESSVRVRTDRLDRLIDMVGELVIAQSMLASDETIQQGENHELARKISHAGKIVRELQDLSMAMRMVPLKATFQKMARLVRDVAQKCGKHVEFVTEGEDTEIDRNMVDIIADPLVHMVRNAVDHGIEMPDAREANGKSHAGTVRLAAYHAGGSVVVELQDDGKGLDKDKILQKALEKGLVEPDKTMSEGEIFNLIFAPGFSTAEQVTDMSGRGVGMDVVRRNIEAMRGHVEITSEKGKGSTFIIRLPLTLAITDGMLVRVGSERFIVPTVNIHLSFSPPASSLSTISGRGEMVMLRGELLPIIRLHQLFDVENAVEETTKGLLMIVADGRRRCALLVDELLGQQQVVAKSLGQGIGKIQGVSGGAILGDGRVGLILDTAEIVALARQATARTDRKDLIIQQQAA